LDPKVQQPRKKKIYENISDFDLQYHPRVSHTWRAGREEEREKECAERRRLEAGGTGKGQGSGMGQVKRGRQVEQGKKLEQRK
jgi:hypothetical protein